MMRWVTRLTVALAVLAGAAAAQAQTSAPGWPTKPVRVLVPFAAGGAVDIVARLLGQHLTPLWGQQVVVENKPGAGGVIASEALVKSPPDGHMLLLVASGHAVNPELYTKLPYDTLKDFTAISVVGSAPNMLLVNAQVPARTVAELIALAKKEPGKLSYGMAGAGTSTHLAGELFKHLTQVDLTSVPYKGGAPALADLVAGQIPVSFNNIPESIGQVRSGTVRPLGVTTAARSPILPDVPAIADTVPGYDTGVWWGLVAPAGLPAAITAKIHADLVTVLAEPAVKDRFATLGAVPIGNTPAEFDALIRKEAAMWRPVIKAAGIKLE